MELTRHNLRKLSKDDLIDIILAQDKRIKELEAKVSELTIMCEKLGDQVTELKGQIAKNSSNSSKPPSMDGFNKPKPKSLRKKGKKKSGGQHGRKGKTLKMVERPDEIIVHALNQCPCGCGSSLENEPCLNHERRQVFELPKPKLIVIEHQAEKKKCPKTGKIVTANFPKGVNAPVQYGPGLNGFLVYLRNQQLLPLKRISQLCLDLFKHYVSQATIISASNQVANSLNGFKELLENKLKNSSILHVDETGLKIEAKPGWLHVLSTTRLTWYKVHRKRGLDATLDLLSDFCGRLIHDCWKPYFKLKCVHALCNAHILRELIFCYEELDQRWAKKMEKYLLGIHNLVERKKHLGESSFGVEQQKRIKNGFDYIISLGRLEQPPIALSPAPKKRGRKKQSKQVNLLDRLDIHRDLILAFAMDFNVPFTNNLAERDVRMMKLQQKISGTFRTFEGAQTFALVRSYLSTVRKNDLDIFSAIKDALCGRPFLPVGE